MTALPVEVLSLAALADMRGASGPRLATETVLPAGRYERRPMFRVDADDLEPEQHDLFAAYRERLMQDYPAVDRVVLHGALVCGQGAVIAGNRHLLRESAVEFLAHGRVPDGLDASPAGGFHLAAQVARRIGRPTMLLQRPWFANYGHWLVDGAAMLALLPRVAMPAGWQIMIGAQPSTGMRDIVLETLSILAPGVGIVERPQHEVWQFDELHYLSPIHVPPLYKHPEAIACLRGGVVRDRIAGGSRSARLFVRRGDVASRRLDNEEEVVDFLSTRGFGVLRNEPRPVREQARLFRSAQVVVGVKGAALTNMMFATSGSHLVALSPGDFPDPFFWDLVGQCGVNYSEIFGGLVERHRPQSHNAFRIDIGKLRAVMDAVEERLAG